jgi:hypothetical protein
MEWLLTGKGLSLFDQFVPPETHFAFDGPYFVTVSVNVVECEGAPDGPVPVSVMG